LRPIYKFDDVEVDVPNFRVLKRGETLAVEPKSLNVLIFLIEKRGRLIEKRELMDAVWGEAFVTENVLTRAITQLRKAIGDDVREARYIETVPTRGYRFIGQVIVDGKKEHVSADQPESSASVGGQRYAATSTHTTRWYALAGVAGVLLAITVALILVRQVQAPPGLEILRSTQLTTSTGLAFCPTLSPDGTQMAYSTDDGHGFEIVVRQLIAGGKEVQVTRDGGQNVQPAWSADGNLLVYHSASRRGLWIIPALGGTERKLTDFGSHPSWSRDGQWIVFQSSALDDFSADSNGIMPPSTIWVIRPDGSDARQVTQPGRPIGAHGAPSWSPDSKHIVFVEDSSAAIWAIARDGSGLIQLTDQSYRSYDPVYSPDGKSVLYGAANTAGSGQLYGLSQLRVSPETSAPLGKPVQLMSSNGLDVKNLSFSADGKTLAYAALSLKSSLQSLQLSKSMDPIGEPAAITSSFGCRATLPSFSPNGLLLVFNSCLGKTGEVPQIASMNADGSNLQQLTMGDRSILHPSWYPDNRHVLACSVLENKLVSVDLSTRERKVVANVDDDSGEFALSPDGSETAVNTLIDGAPSIRLMNMANGAMRPLTTSGEQIAYPSWSPDGKFIAAEGVKGADNDVVVVEVATGKVEELVPFHGKQWVRDWSPDGDKVFFARQSDDLEWNIWWVSRSTKEQKQVTHYTDRNSYVRYPTVSVSDKLVYEYTETSGNIWMPQFK
jgi:Tol biopolymer transport system component/DNA-binding winged helix-turn-helix (wHTH) protein